MPWNNQAGGSGGDSQGPRGPWGKGPSGGAGGKPPDLEELLRRGQDRLRRILPGGGMTTGGIAILALLLVVVWLLTGIYTVTRKEQGVVLRFGAYVARTAPGIHYHLPWPIETVETPEVTSLNQIAIGYRLGTETNEDAESDNLQKESLMLTGDENIVDVNFTVNWFIKDAAEYLFNVDDPQKTIKAVAESAMREVVGQTQIEPILTQDRARIGSEVRDLMEKTLDLYKSGIAIDSVTIQKADVPEDVKSAYRDVQAARADQETARNKAEAYANKIIPEARGNAAKIVQDSEAYRQKVIAEAEGEAKRFVSVYEQYKKAPDVTRRRMYIETMSHVLGGLNKVIVDDSVGRGVVPYLALPGLDRTRTPSVSVTEPVSQAPGSGSAQTSLSAPQPGATQ